MQRYFVKPNQMESINLTITGNDVHHIKNVMRFREGQEIIVSNGQGKDVKAKITSFSDDTVRAQIVAELEENRELPVRVSIAQGLPKGDKMETIIQKGTELGAFQFIPFSSRRTVVKLNEKKANKKIDRWSIIAKEAAEQSHRSLIPTVSRVLSWRQLLLQGENFDIRLIAYENEEKITLYQALKGQLPGVSILLAIGPEGGWDPEEVEEAVQSGFTPVSLGKRILRTETAALYGLSCMSYHYEQIQG